MRPMPTGSAAARQTVGISSAGVTTAASSIAYSIAGFRTKPRKARPTHSASASKKARRRGTASVDERAHPHMLERADRRHRTEHGEPQEEDRGELVGPDQRRVQDIARDDAGEEDQRFERDERARERLDDAPDRKVDRRDQHRRARPTGFPQRGRARCPRERIGIDAEGLVDLDAGASCSALQLSPPSTARQTPVI